MFDVNQDCQVGRIWPIRSRSAVVAELGLSCSLVRRCRFLFHFRAATNHDHVICVASVVIQTLLIAVLFRRSILWMAFPVGTHSGVADNFVRVFARVQVGRKILSSTARTKAGRHLIHSRFVTDGRVGEWTVGK